MEARPAGLHTPQLLSACELSLRQAEAGLAMLRDIITEMGWPPLIWIRVDGYQFTVDGEELERTEHIMRFGEYSTHELSDAPEAYEVHLDVDFTQLDADVGPEAEMVA